MSLPKNILSARQLSIGFSSRRGKPAHVVASGINKSLSGGEVICLLGPNGSGKSTLIQTLTGLHDPLEGSVMLEGCDIGHYSVSGLAQKISTVLTDRPLTGNLSVYELISFGRSPYTGWFGSMKKNDEEVINQAVQAIGIEKLLERDVLHLSDGETKKVMIARALAQDTSAILLDEPTAHLDLPSRVEIIRLLRKLAGDTQKAILFSTHELDLALKAADTLWLMKDKEIFSGTPEDLVLDGTFEKVFDQQGFDYDRESGSFRVHQSTGKKVYVEGDQTAVFWTKRALRREGFEILPTSTEQALKIAVKNHAEGFRWNFVDSRKQLPGCTSIFDLLEELRENNGPL